MFEVHNTSGCAALAEAAHVAVAAAADEADDAISAGQALQALDRPGRRTHYDQLKGLRVLFVDDDLRTREVVLEVLQYTGALVQAAASAAEGVAAIAAFDPQVILCDITMPDEDGYAFMRKLRTREAARVPHRAPIPALALTALSTDGDRQRALAAGFQLHMAKPIDIDRLRTALVELYELSKPQPAGGPDDQ